MSLGQPTARQQPLWLAAASQFCPAAGCQAAAPRPPKGLPTGPPRHPGGRRATRPRAAPATSTRARAALPTRRGPSIATHQGARWRALTLPRRRRNVSVLRLMRPPSSTPNTTSLQRLARWSSGYVRCFRSRAWARARPGSLSAPKRALPSRLTGLTIVASTATWAPCQGGRPFATTSMRRPSAAGTSRFKSRRATFVATRAPASLQMRAAARSSRPARLASADLGAGGAVVPKVVQEATASAVLGGQRACEAVEPGIPHLALPYQGLRG